NAPVGSLATSRFFTVSASQLGAHAARFALWPQAGVSNTPRPADFGAELAGRLRAGPGTYELQAPFFVDQGRTPMEDPSVNWEESVSPYVTVGRLTLPQQDVDSPEGRALAERAEKLSFDPWHARADMRPLGGLMRARNVAYRVSTQERGAAPEPDDR